MMTITPIPDPILLAAMDTAQWAYTYTLRALHTLQAEQAADYAAEQRLRKALNRARLDCARAWVAVCETECDFDLFMALARGEG